MMITLPYSGDIYNLRDPKGKDLRILSQHLQGGANLGVDNVFLLISMLATPTLTQADLDDMDGEDVTALMSAIKSIRSFSNKHNT